MSKRKYKPGDRVVYADDPDSTAGTVVGEHGAIWVRWDGSTDAGPFLPDDLLPMPVDPLDKLLTAIDQMWSERLDGVVQAEAAEAVVDAAKRVAATRRSGWS